MKVVQFENHKGDGNHLPQSGFVRRGLKLGESCHSSKAGQTSELTLNVESSQDWFLHCFQQNINLLAIGWYKMFAVKLMVVSSFQRKK